MTELERFWSKVAKGGPDDCWPWTGGFFRKTGYGQVRYAGRPQGAHRVAWMLATGQEPPPGQDIRHSCDNRPCCNPAHLSPGTRAENMRDAVERGRMSRGAAHAATLNPARGERHGHAKLTWSQVGEIRRRGVLPGVTQRALAAEFNVTRRAIGMILRGERWAPAKEE